MTTEALLLTNFCACKDRSRRTARQWESQRDSFRGTSPFFFDFEENKACNLHCRPETFEANEIRHEADDAAEREPRDSIPNTFGADGSSCWRTACQCGQRCRWLGPDRRGYGDAEWLAREFELAGTSRVGVGFITWSLAKRPTLLELALERRPVAVMLSFGDPAPFVEQIKRGGAKLICQVQTVAMARDAAAKGADVLVAQGAEAGGHGLSRGTMVLVPAVADAVGPNVPVIAAGGIGDGRGLAAALMLGASGVLMGTRFFASEEALGNPAVKEQLLRANGDETVRSSVFDIARRLTWPAPITGRALRNAYVDHWLGREADLLRQIDVEAARYAAGAETGDFDIAVVHAGEVVDLINDLPPAAVIVERVVSQAIRLLSNQ